MLALKAVQDGFLGCAGGDEGWVIEGGVQGSPCRERYVAVTPRGRHGNVLQLTAKDIHCLPERKVEREAEDIEVQAIAHGDVEVADPSCDLGSGGAVWGREREVVGLDLRWGEFGFV